MRINKEGYKIIGISGAVCLLLWWLFYHLLVHDANVSLLWFSTLVLLLFWFFIVAFFRELLGSGTLLGFNILNYEPIQNIGYVNNGLMLMPPMALIIVACIIWYQRARHKELQEESN